MPTWPKMCSWLKGVAPLPVLIAGALSPAGADAQGKTPAFAHSVKDAVLPTTEYTLAEGESVQSIAQDYDLSVEDLRKLNISRTFSQGFEQLKPGERLLVPLRPLSTPQQEMDRPSSPALLKEEGASQDIARLATRLAPFLTPHQTRDAAVRMTRRVALNSGSNRVEQWLSHWGTSRVRVDADRTLSLKSAQLDLLTPLWEPKGRMVFAQGSIHHIDERTQLNLGIGLRQFTHHAMVGGNGFFDADLSHGHARIGLGLEYWRHFLKLGINSYVRVSNWRIPHGVVDYQERAANGWDVRAEAYLPRWPQLGGELIYEQYYGKNVALFGKENQQRNPYALSTGIRYTPIPLVTLSADLRQGKSGESDSRLGLQFNYQLGVPWERQIRPDSVGALRRLTKRRYDVVERNNHVVLEYRRKAGMHLDMTRRVTGFSGERKVLTLVVNRPHELAHIDWHATELIAAGGSIETRGIGAYVVVLPAYQDGERADNTYHVSAVAVDSYGHRSNTVETQISVTAHREEVQHGGFSPEQSQLSADGRRRQVLTLFLQDRQQRPLDLPVSAIRLITKGRRSAFVSTLTRQAAGIYQVTVRAGRDEETLTLEPWLGNQRLRIARVYITRAELDAVHSAFTVNPSSIVANGVAYAHFSFTAVDAKGNAVSGIADRLSFIAESSNGKALPAGKIMISDVRERGTTGRYTAMITGTQAGRYTIRPQLNGSDVGRLSTSIELSADVTSARVEKLSVDKSLLIGDGNDYAQYIATVSDAYGNPVPNAAVQWRHSVGHLSANSTLTSAKGEARVSVKSAEKGKVSVSASINRSSVVDSSVKAIGLVEDSWSIAGSNATYSSRPIRGYSSLGFVAKAPTYGPKQLVWRTKGYETLTATLLNEADENSYAVVFRAYRQSGCQLRPFNAAIHCPVAGNGMRAKLIFSADDNPPLPPGRYVGDIHFAGKTWHDDYNVEYLLHVALRIVK